MLNPFIPARPTLDLLLLAKYRNGEPRLDIVWHYYDTPPLHGQHPHWNINVNL